MSSLSIPRWYCISLLRKSHICPRVDTYNRWQAVYRSTTCKGWQSNVQVITNFGSIIVHHRTINCTYGWHLSWLWRQEENPHLYYCPHNIAGHASVRPHLAKQTFVGAMMPGGMALYRLLQCFDARMAMLTGINDRVNGLRCWTAVCLMQHTNSKANLRQRWYATESKIRFTALRVKLGRPKWSSSQQASLYASLHLV